MTRPSLREYAAVQRERYLGATRTEKGQLLDEVGAVTGLHRKAAIRLLRFAPRGRLDCPGRGGASMGEPFSFAMPVEEAITTQRALRRLRPDPVPDALVLRLLGLALKAASTSMEDA